MEWGRRRKGLGHRNHGKKSEDIECESSQKRVDVQMSSSNKSSVSARKGKKSHEKLKGRRYPLRSSRDDVRVLRSMLTKVNRTVSPASTKPVITSEVKRQRKRRAKKAVKDEYSKIRKHVRYLLHRMAYGQSFINAYASEGWKGQSLEKIRPEKELQRAKSEIVKCKLRIRGQFQQLDSLISEGRLEDSMFDSEGQIDSEDIICAKCCSKELSKNNDIILCDGICDKGFHQKCLTPPLLNEDIPPGDEGWLCPACDCKLDCIDFIDELHGSDLTIEDSWEKVFPEAAAIAAGDKKYDDLGLPSDDSEDDDYAPGGPAVDGKVDEGAGSEEEGFEEESSQVESSDESFTSEDPMVPNGGLPSKCLEFPSDDSEDDDFDPNEPNLKVKSQMGGSSSDESDFTSDTDDLDEFSGSKEALASPIQNHVESCVESIRDINKSSENAKLLSLVEQDLDQENVDIISAKRKFERLDYQKLYEETYGNASSDTSDDEEWTEWTNEKMKKVKNDTTGLPSENTCTMNSQRSLRNVHDKSTSLLEDPKLDRLDFSLENTSKHGKRRTRGTVQSGAGNHPIAKQYMDSSKHSSSGNTSRNVLSGDTNACADNSDYSRIPHELSAYSSTKRKFSLSAQHNGSADLDSEGGKNPSSSSRFFGTLVSQKLLESFNENQYPSREKKESLANELGISPKQVDKWFGNARHSFRVSTKETGQVEKCTGNGIITMANSTPVGSPIKSAKATPSSTTRTMPDKSMPVSMKSITPDKGVDSQTFSEGAQQNPQNEATSGAVVVKIGEKTKETLIESIDRQQLVLRELRKRRRGK